MDVMESSIVDSEFTDENMFSSTVDSSDGSSPRYELSDEEDDQFDAATYNDNFCNAKDDSSADSENEGYGEAVFEKEPAPKHVLKRRAETEKLDFETDPPESPQEIENKGTSLVQQNSPLPIPAKDPEVVAPPDVGESETTLAKNRPQRVPPPPLQLPNTEDWCGVFFQNKFQNDVNIGKNLEKHMVVLEILRCKNLRNSDTSSKSDPFVSIRYPDMDKFERQSIFTTRRTEVVQNNLHPSFNKVFRFPLHEEDLNAIEQFQEGGSRALGAQGDEKAKLAEAGVSLVHPSSPSDKAFKRFGVHISAFDHDSSGDHDPLGETFVYFSQLATKPFLNDESESARIELDLIGEGALENSSIIIRGWLQPPLSSLKAIEENEEMRKKVEEDRVQQEQNEKNQSESEKQAAVAAKRKVDRLIAMEQALTKEGQYSSIGISDKDVETVKQMVSKITSMQPSDNNEEFDRDGVKFRSYLSLARLARTTNALRTLIGQLLIGSGVSMAMSDLAHKTPRLRRASASLLLSLVHNHHAGNTRILKSHSGFQIQDVHVFWIPESLRDAYLDAGSRRKAEDSQREKDGRRKRKPVSWWPPSEKGFVSFLKEKLKRSLSADNYDSSKEEICDHSYEESPLKIVCFPPAPAFRKKKGTGNGMAWFLSELVDQSQNGTMFSVLRGGEDHIIVEEDTNEQGENEEKVETIAKRNPTIPEFEEVLHRFKLRAGIDKIDFDRFVSIFTQTEINGVKRLNLNEMERALLPPSESTKDGYPSQANSVLDRVIPFLKNLVRKGTSALANTATEQSNEEEAPIEERGIYHIYKLSDANNDGKVSVKELVRVLSTLINGGNEFESEEAESLCSFFDRNGSGTIERDVFERSLTEWSVKAGASDRNDSSIFSRLAAVEDADQDAQIVDWVPDPETFLLGFRLPQNMPEEATNLSPRSKSLAQGISLSDPSADAREIADITRLRKIFESLNKDQTGRVSCKVLKNDRVFVELIGRSGALKIISHFQTEKGAVVDKTGEVCVSWDELVEYRRYLKYTEMVAIQQHEAEQLKTKPVHLFSMKPKRVFSQGGKDTKLDGLPRFREAIMDDRSSSLAANLAKLPRTHVLVKIYGEPARQKIRFDCVLRPSDGSLYRARIPISKVLPAKDTYDISEILTLDKETIRPFLEFLVLPPHHIHAGDNTKLRSTVPTSLEDWARQNKHILLRQVKKGQGMALLKKEKAPDAIALKGLQVGLELFKQNRKVEVWRLLEQTVHLIIKACPVSANRSILITRALDTLISQYKLAKSMSEGTDPSVSPNNNTSEHEKGLFLLRDSVRSFRKTYIAATSSMKSKRREQLRRIQVLETPAFQNRRVKQLKRDKTALRRIVEENRRRVEKEKVRRVEAIQDQSAAREARLKEYTERVATRVKERKRAEFVTKQKNRMKERKLEHAKATEERKWMVQKRRLDAKRLAMEKKERKKAEELRDRKNKEAKQEVIKRQQAFLLAKAEKSFANKRKKSSGEHHKENRRPSEIHTHERLLKFGEKIAAQRKQSKSSFKPKNTRYSASGEKEYLSEVEDVEESQDDMVVSEM